MANPSSSRLDRVEEAIKTGEVPEDLRISLTPEAVRQGERLAHQPENQGKPLRLYLEGKGCDGFFYGISFSEPLDEDLSFPQGSLDLVVDRETMRYVCGSSIEWVDDERGQGFLVHNPHHKKFRGKFFKRKGWLERLTRQDETTPSSEG